MLGCQNTALAILYTKDILNATYFSQNSQKPKKVAKKPKIEEKTIVRKAKTRVFAQNTDVHQTKMQPSAKTFLSVCQRERAHPCRMRPFDIQKNSNDIHVTTLAPNWNSMPFSSSSGTRLMPWLSMHGCIRSGWRQGSPSSHAHRSHSVQASVDST